MMFLSIVLCLQQVNFSEPLSFLQRLTEDFEYSDILDRASQVGGLYPNAAPCTHKAFTRHPNATRL